MREQNLQTEQAISSSGGLTAELDNQQVEVIEYPISDRYCHKGEIGTIRNGQIRVGGAWFNFDVRWVVKPCS